MSYVVISSFEDIASGDLQAQGEAVTVFAAEAPARAHFSARTAALERAADSARERDAAATLVSWIVLLRMPIEVATVEEALEDLEIVIDETESPDDPFGELVVDYVGHRHAPGSTEAYPQKLALEGLQAWLT